MDLVLNVAAVLETIYNGYEVVALVGEFPVGCL